ncbi:MAG: Hpt domain-containing protein [Bacteroidota bacterium]|nr:Hpt domain-containing protein [Bacteroidota bacterium]
MKDRKDLQIMDYKFIKTDYLEMVAGGDGELLKELINMFRDQVAEFSEEMKKLLQEKNYYELGLLAHKAKSSVSIMGMDSLANLLKTFELQAKTSLNIDRYQSYVTRFENDTRSALAELETLIEKQ